MGKDNEERINQQVEEIYLELNESEKAELIKKDKESVTDNIIGGSVVLAIAVMILLGVIAISANDILTLLVSMGIVVVVLVVGLVCLIHYKKSDKKKLDEQRIKRQLKISIEKKHNFINYDSIVKVTLIDSYTEVSDKLHAVLNYQEIIQTRYYKFKIDFKDGTSKIVTEQENSENYNKLMSLIGTEKPQDRTEELRKYKELLDAGVITEEEFDAKKKQILGL